MYDIYVIFNGMMFGVCAVLGMCGVCSGVLCWIGVLFDVCGVCGVWGFIDC